jgi:hypothetical protein
MRNPSIRTKKESSSPLQGRVTEHKGTLKAGRYVINGGHVFKRGRVIKEAMSSNVIHEQWLYQDGPNRDACGRAVDVPD